jgi:hypothetical protein
MSGSFAGCFRTSMIVRPWWCKPPSLEATEPVEAWAALLPPLDPTTMGWFERDWHLGPYKESVV